MSNVCQSQSELVFVEMKQEFLPELASLFERTYKKRRHADHDRHKYYSNPAGDVIAFCVFDAERMVGFYGIIPCVFRMGKEQVLGAQSVDTMVDPNYQGRGLFVQLAERVFKLANDREVKLVLGFPNKNSLPGFTRRLGWCDIGEINFYLRVVSTKNIRRVPRFLKSIVQLLINIIPKGRVGDFSVSKRPVQNAELESLIENWSGKIGKDEIFVGRSKAWYQWRYSDKYEVNYMAYIATNKTSTETATIIVGEKDGMLYMSDALWDTKDAFYAAFRMLINDQGSEGAIGIIGMSSNKELSAILKSVGFLKYRSLSTIVRPLSFQSLPVNIYDLDNWKLFGGDSDTL